MSLEIVTSKVKITARPEDIDEYGHLNNAKFPKYFEEGRLALQRNAGLTAQSLIEKKVGLFVYRVTYTYKKQVFEGEELCIDSRFIPFEEGITIDSFHRMFSNRKLVATANITHAFNDLNTGRLITKVPDWFIEKMYQRIK